MNSRTEPLKIANPTVIREHRNGYWLTADNPLGGAFGYIKCETNMAGKLILELIDGRRDVNDIISVLCTTYELDVLAARGWILEFVDEMIKRKVVTTQQNATHTPITVLGNGQNAFPAHVAIEVTESCNLKCSFCYLSAGPDKKDRLNWEELIEFLDDLKAHGLTSISLTGGEYFLHPNAIDILSYCCREFPGVGILTNGTAIPRTAMDILQKYKDQVTVSISVDSVRPDLHNEIRGGKKAFQKTTKTIRELAKRGIAVRVPSVITEQNMWEIHELAELAISLGAIAFSFNFVESFGRGKNVRGADKGGAGQEYARYVSDVVEQYSEFIPISKGEDLEKERLNCGAGISSVVIGADGSVRPCSLFPKSSKFKNIRDASLSSILDEEIYRAIEKIPAPSEKYGCPLDCSKYDECSGCYLRGLNANVDRTPDKYCNWIVQNRLEELIKLLRPEPVQVKIGPKPVS